MNPHRGNTAAMVGAVLALIALAFCWIPLVGMLTIPLALIALVLAGIGLLVTLFRHGAGLIASVGGGVLALLAIAVSFLSTGAAITAAVDAADKSFQAAHTTATPEPADSAPAEPAQVATAPAEAGASATTVPVDESGESPSPTPAPRTRAEPPVPTAPAPQPASKEPDWTIAPAASQIGNAQVTVVSAAIGKAPLKDLLGKATESVDDMLIVRLKIENLSESRKLNFRGFDPTFSLGNDVARLRDNHDNVYKRVGFGATKVDGQIENASIYPRKALDDVLVFEIPVEDAEYLRLELPAENLDQKGSFKFQIARSMIQEQSDADAQVASVLGEAITELKRLVAERDRILKRRPTKAQQAAIEAFGTIFEEYKRRSEKNEAEAAHWLLDQVKGKAIRDFTPTKKR